MQDYAQSPEAYGYDTTYGKCVNCVRGVISAILSNLFLHYVFDSWMSREHKGMQWCRYADDGLVHCRTELEAKQLLADLKARFKECKLELHPDKTKIIYCKDSNRKGNHTNTKFDFLGYTFRGRTAKGNEKNNLFVSFSPAVSKESLNAIWAETRERKFWRRSDLELEDIAKMFNPVLNGWLNYYGCFNRSALYPMLRQFNKTLVAYLMRKYRELAGHKVRAARVLEGIAKKKPWLFAHWKRGMFGSFA